MPYCVVFGVQNSQKGSIWANLVLKTMKKREIDNIDLNKALYLLKLHQTALIDSISPHKSYQGHIA